jgi:hypothetical protein
MLSSVSNAMRSIRKLHRFVNIGLALLAMMLVASPGVAAGAGPRPLQSQPAQSQPQSPNATCPPGGQCFADVPSGNPFYAFINRIYQQNLVTGYPCGGTGEPCDSFHRPYYRPAAGVTRSQMAKFIDNARRLPQIHIDTESSDPAIYISSTVSNGLYAQTYTATAIYGKATGGGIGVHGDGGQLGIYGTSSAGYGVWGVSDTGTGVQGNSTQDDGMYGGSQNGDGVHGYSITGNGVSGDTTSGLAGYFHGNVQVTGNLSKGGGSFKIDDPIDPADKYLYHSFVESPDMMDIYNGNVTTNANGDATIQMPAWFQPLNRDFRYQLTPIGQFAQAMVSSEIKDNSFSIKTDKPNVKVSWQVTGIRQDPYANAHRIPVEEDKPANERGKYLYPTEYGQPASSGIYQSQQLPQQAQPSKP